jgi:hypothetical protein
MSMCTEKRIESSCLIPSDQQIRFRVPKEPTNIGYYLAIRVEEAIPPAKGIPAIP